MIKLYQFGECWGLPDASPFCMKIYTYLKLCGIPFESVSTPDPRKGPKGKLPFIEDDAESIGDSSLIIHYLKDRYGDSLDSKLTDNQKAIGLAFQTLAEDHLYWVIVYDRWINPANTEITKHAYFGNMPDAAREATFERARQKMEGYLFAIGLGRHTPEEVYQFGIKDIQAIGNFMGNKLFLLGDEPSSFDACLFSFIASIFKCPIDSPVKQELKLHTHLKQYCDRMFSKIGLAAEN